MAVPVVAIVGRPNVGKSSLFNWLAGRRIAIVDPTAGVTRDRVSSLIKLGDRFVELVDTGGMGVQDVDNLTEHIERQIDLAIDQAAVILFVVDARSGLVPLDQKVAARLRHLSKPILCVANKCDTPEMEPQAAEFHRLGRGQLVFTSVEQNRGREELLHLLAQRLPEPDGEEYDPAVQLKVAIVGRPNTGKSTFINSLAQKDRMIVSEVPGTTRDSVDVRFQRDNKIFIAIDTAGVRRRKNITDDVTFYSLHRAERSIRRADVVLLFFDPRLRVSKLEKQLADYILEQHKPAVFVVNKWDLAASKIPTERFTNYLHRTFPGLDFVPIAYITAKEGKNVFRLLNLAQSLHKQALGRVSTGELNRVVQMAVERQSPPMRQNRTARIYYATQVAASPPTIVLFTNGPELFDEPYTRYLLRTFRDELPFHEVPIKLHLRRKSRDDRVPRKGRGVSGRESQEPVDRPPDVSELDFRSTVSDEELRREGERYESELWKNL